MRNFIAALAFLFGVGLCVQVQAGPCATGLDAGPSVSAAQEGDSRSGIFHMAAEIGHGHDHDKGSCCWNSLCFDPAHCHHAAVSAALVTSPVPLPCPTGRDVFQVAQSPRPRPPVHYFLIDPPRA
jgi:hypothetical protein